MLVAALNGSRMPGSHPALPLTAGELAADAVACVRAGGAAVHIHARSSDGMETLDPEVVDETVRAVRAAAGVPVGVSTGAWIEPDPVRRAELVSGWREPDMASVNLSEEGAGSVIEALLGAGIGVEAGVWTVGDAEYLAASGAAAGIDRVLVEIVHPTPDPVGEVTAIERTLDRLGIGLPRLIHGEEEATWPVLRYAVALGHDTRVGLEDTLHLPDGAVAASNASLVEAFLALRTR
ncbi:MAG TPA: 3-keto-5-aminohexanoate cleavage protein [Acidimicrobiales bacterium]|nr:3-keto-5-aminohexanoate cleavage protein [Acidimicrobiales bacterium]